MAETILTPGKDNSSNTEQTPTIDPGYLVKDNLLSEFKTEAEKSAARYNLGVLPAENVYTKEEIEPVIVLKISSKIAEHLDSSDHITLKEVLDMLIGLIRDDGTTPFTAPQAGVDPVSNHDLATKIYVDRLIQSCLKTVDKNKILEQVVNTLRDYVLYDDVYTRDKVYTKDLVDNLVAKYVKIDGSTPFEKPQSGRTPLIGSHLTTKNYVDTLLQSHKEDIDPHGFTERLNTKLKKYALKDNVLDRTLVYSRKQIDEIIEKLVTQAVREELEFHEGLEDPHNILLKIELIGYVNKNGSIAFTAPQKGVDAVNPPDLVTLRQLDAYRATLLKSIDLKLCNWITSGPSEATVGNVLIDTDFPTTMSVQEILDAIFYGRGISLHVPEYSNITEECPVKVCVHGSVGLVDYAELYREGVLIASFTSEDFSNDRCRIIMAEPILEDTNFTFKVTYLSGAVHEETKMVKCSMPMFIGLLPKWKFGNTVTYGYLLELANEDGINNKFYHKGGEDIVIVHKYDFMNKSLMHLVAVVPESYPDLYQMRIPSQQFEKEAFDIIDMIPFKIPGVEKDIIYKMYIYRQALYTANLETTFKFKNNE